MDAAVLELGGVTAGYGPSTVLSDVSLTLQPGRAAVLLGPNGAGKTTLLRVASGLLSPRIGTVTVHGDDARRLKPHEFAARGVCHIPEGRGIFPSLTVEENIRAFARRGDNDRDAAERAIMAFPTLASLTRQTAGTLSGGQQQMLALARAWVTNSHLVLVDEPSLGLAPLIVDGVYEFLERLAAQGGAMLIVEQYVDKALAIADDVHVLVHGRIVYSGIAQDIDRDELASYYLATDSH